MSALHILNGEGTYISFKETDLNGKIAIWNEALCQGPSPVTTDVKDFNSMRIPFLVECMKVTPAMVQQKMDPTWQMLAQLEGIEEVILWFEFDLFCQANLLYLCHWLHLYPKRHFQVSLVSPRDHASVPHFRGMGQLSPRALAGLFPNRITLTEEDLEFAHHTWGLWANQDLLGLQNIEPPANGHWPHLKAALTTMFQELPDRVHGLARSERFILTQLQEGPKTPRQLFNAFMVEFDQLGYGDLQFFQLVDGLAPAFLVQDQEAYRLTPTGQSSLHAQSEHLPPTLNRWVGPCWITSPNFLFRWDNDHEKVVSLV